MLVPRSHKYLMVRGLLSAMSGVRTSNESTLAEYDGNWGLWVLKNVDARLNNWYHLVESNAINAISNVLLFQTFFILYQ